MKAFIRRYASAEIDDNGKTTLRELATLRHGQNLHENFIRYFGMEDDAEDDAEDNALPKTKDANVTSKGPNFTYVFNIFF